MECGEASPLWVSDFVFLLPEGQAFDKGGKGSPIWVSDFVFLLLEGQAFERVP